MTSPDTLSAARSRVGVGAGSLGGRASRSRWRAWTWSAGMSFQRHRSWPISATLLEPGRTPRRPEPLHLPPRRQRRRNPPRRRPA